MVCYVKKCSNKSQSPCKYKTKKCTYRSWRTRRKKQPSLKRIQERDNSSLQARVFLLYFCKIKISRRKIQSEPPPPPYIFTEMNPPGAFSPGFISSPNPRAIISHQVNHTTGLFRFFRSTPAISCCPSKTVACFPLWITNFRLRLLPLLPLFHCRFALCEENGGRINKVCFVVGESESRPSKWVPWCRHQWLMMTCWQFRQLTTHLRDCYANRCDREGKKYIAV